jgi:hypothetical protein
MTTKLALQKTFKGILNTENKDKHNHENVRKKESHRWSDKEMQTRKKANITKQQNDKK